MQKREDYIREIKSRSCYLYNRESFMEQLMIPLANFIPHEASGVCGTIGSSFDPRAIQYGYSKNFAMKWMNQNIYKTARYGGHFEEGLKRGYSTLPLSESIKHDPQQEYNRVYKNTGTVDSEMTIFFDQTGSIMGMYACNRYQGSIFNEKERILFDAIAPYIFYAFRKYRWLLGIDFFTASSLDDLIFGIVTADKKGRITWMNSAAKDIVGNVEGNPPDRITGCMKDSLKRLKNVSLERGPISFAYRRIDDICDYGTIVAFRLNEESAKYLPVEGEGTAFFIDTRVVDHKIGSELTRREKEVIELIAKGLTDIEIADILSLSERTVQVYIQNIFKKLEVSNRTEAAVKAVRLGIT